MINGPHGRISIPVFPVFPLFPLRERIAHSWSAVSVRARALYRSGEDASRRDGHLGWDAGSVRRSTTTIRCGMNSFRTRLRPAVASALANVTSTRVRLASRNGLQLAPASDTGLSPQRRRYRRGEGRARATETPIHEGDQEIGITVFPMSLPVTIPAPFPRAREAAIVAAFVHPAPGTVMLDRTPHRGGLAAGEGASDRSRR